MRRRHALSIAIAAALGALAIVALPALAGARDDNHHHRGARDRHENVGRISAFDSASGQLTIARFGGGAISGLVTGSTEIRCEGRDESARVSRDHGSNSGPGSGSDDDNGARACTTADLTVGTVVHDVDRSLGNGVTTFDEIELGHPS
jgi:hypothetical protein